MYLDSQFKIKGYWWLPKTQTKRISGELTCFQDGRVELDVLGSFFEPPMGIGDLPILPIILGVSEKGKPITLVHCMHLNWSVNLPGIANSKILARFLIVGAHFHERTELTFSQATFRTFGLDEWLNISGFTVNHDFENKTFDIHFAPPPVIEDRVSDDIKISIRFSWTGPNFGAINSIKMTQKAYLRLDYREERDIEELVSNTHKIKNLLSLAFGQPTSLREMSVSKSSFKKKVGETEFLEQLDVYYQSIPSLYPKRSFYSQEMVFNFQEIKEHLGTTVQTWLKMYEKFESAINLYFATLYNEELYIDNKFLGLIQGLETYHRNTTDNRTLPQEKHEERIDIILNSVPQEYKSWLREKLAYSNEPSLRQRLKNLLEPFSDLFGNKSKHTQFINSVVITRNYLTHYDKKLKSKAAYGADLFSLVQNLRALFILHLLIQLDFEKDKVTRMIASNPYFKINE